MNRELATCKEMLRLLFKKIAKHMLSFKQKGKRGFLLCFNLRHLSPLFRGYQDVLKRK